METNPKQPPKKRKECHDYREDRSNPDFSPIGHRGNGLNLNGNASSPEISNVNTVSPGSSNVNTPSPGSDDLMESNVPLDFSVKNGSGSISPNSPATSSPETSVKCELSSSPRYSPTLPRRIENADDYLFFQDLHLLKMQGLKGDDSNKGPTHSRRKLSEDRRRDRRMEYSQIPPQRHFNGVDNKGYPSSPPLSNDLNNYANAAMGPTKYSIHNPSMSLFNHAQSSNGFNQGAVSRLDNYNIPNSSNSYPSNNGQMSNGYMQATPELNGLNNGFMSGLGGNGLLPSIPINPMLGISSFLRPPFCIGLPNGSNGFGYGSKSSTRPFKTLAPEILNHPCNKGLTFMQPNYVETTPQTSPDSNQPSGSCVENSIKSLSDAEPTGSREPVCSTQQVLSEDSQNSNNSHQQQDSPDSYTPSRRKGQKIPDEKKDKAYYEKRRKNNLAAKRSRDTRRMKEDAMALTAKSLMEINKSCEYELQALRLNHSNLQAEHERVRNMNISHMAHIESLKREIVRLKRAMSRNGCRPGSESPSL